MNYGINILTIEPSKIISVKGVSKDYKSMLESNGIYVREVNVKNLTKGYGGPHCMTQALRRES